MTRHYERRGTDGLGVDWRGNPVVDPTANVIALSKAANKRQDDLRLSEARLLAATVARLDREMELQDRIAALRADHAAELRAQDVAARTITAERSLVSVQTLAATTSKNIEQLQGMIETSRTGLLAQFDRAINSMNERVSGLERTSYTGLGKQEVIDPALAELVVEVRRMSANNERRSGQDSGISVAWMALIGVVSMVVGLITIGAFIFTFTGRAAAATPAPGQVIYVPSPPGTMLPSTPPAVVPR